MLHILHPPFDTRLLMTYTTPGVTNISNTPFRSLCQSFSLSVACTTWPSGKLKIFFDFSPVGSISPTSFGAATPDVAQVSTIPASSWLYCSSILSNLAFVAEFSLLNSPNSCSISSSSLFTSKVIPCPISYLVFSYFWRYIFSRFCYFLVCFPFSACYFFVYSCFCFILRRYL